MVAGAVEATVRAALAAAYADLAAARGDRASVVEAVSAEAAAQDLGGGAGVSS